ncbi:MAG TPA: cold shock domain-containing protein [Solirubrobacteraceae bacterium]|nr:cold shock domain-containing protein [Solirubrobacteraceae bacterium]
MVRGIVKAWDVDAGWGVLVSDEVPGEVWAHFVHIEGQEGFRELQAGSRVRFDYLEVERRPDGHSDGYAYRATKVWALSDGCSA